eukprot:gene5734-11595_t
MGSEWVPWVEPGVVDRTLAMGLGGTVGARGCLTGTVETVVGLGGRAGTGDCWARAVVRAVGLGWKDGAGDCLAGTVEMAVWLGGAVEVSNCSVGNAEAAVKLGGKSGAGCYFGWGTVQTAVRLGGIVGASDGFTESIGELVEGLRGGMLNVSGLRGGGAVVGERMELSLSPGFSQSAMIQHA